MDDDPSEPKKGIKDDKLGCYKSSSLHSILRHYKTRIGVLWVEVCRELVENQKTIQKITLLS